MCLKLKGYERKGLVWEVFTVQGPNNLIITRNEGLLKVYSWCKCILINAFHYFLSFFTLWTLTTHTTHHTHSHTHVKQNTFIYMLRIYLDSTLQLGDHLR